MTREKAIEYVNAQLDKAVDDADMMEDEMYDALQKLVRIAEQEPCEDAVSRKAVLDLAYCHFDEQNLTRTCKIGLSDYCNKCNMTAADITDIVALPPVHSTEKVGEWIDDEESDFYKKCSLCGVEIDVDFYEETQMNYCPNCGAKMKGENG